MKSGRPRGDRIVPYNYAYYSSSHNVSDHNGRVRETAPKAFPINVYGYNENMKQTSK